MTATDKPRQPKGVKTGGQFAASARPEAGVSLDATAVAPRPDEFLARRAELAVSLRGSSQRKRAIRESRTRDGIVVPTDAAYAVGRFQEGGPTGYRAQGLAEAPLRATREEAEDDWFAAHVTATARHAAAKEALAPALDMNRVEAENHVRSLIDDAAAAGEPERIDEIASLASGRGWKGVAYVRGYPHTGNPESQPTDYLPTKAGATRVAEYAWSRTSEAERQAQDK